MSKYKNEYYVLGGKGNCALDLVSDSNDLYSAEYPTEDMPCELCFLSGKAPKDISKQDYYAAVYHILGQRVKDVLESLNLKNVEFVPSFIMNRKGVQFDSFYLLNVYNRIDCIGDDGINFYNHVDGDKLKDEVLDKIPLEERLVFVVEDELVVLFHQSVIDKIIELKPKGLIIRSIGKDYSSNITYPANYY